MINLLKNPITYLLLLQLGVIIINLLIARIDKESNKKIKKLSLIAAIILSAAIIIQGTIQIRNANYQRNEISDIEVKITFIVNPWDIETLASNKEFNAYKKRINIAPPNQFLSRLETYKREIQLEILKDWSISVSTKNQATFDAKYIDGISKFKFQEVLAGIYSFHLKCEVSYFIQGKRDLDLSNLKELNDNVLSITIVSNPLISDLIVDNIQIEFNTINSPIDSKNKLNFSTRLNEVIPQEMNAIEKIGLDSIATLINFPKENNDFPLTVYTERGDALWVWHALKEFGKHEY